MKNIEKLAVTLIGGADVKGFIFTKYKESKKAYIYQVKIPGVESIHYEVFEKKYQPIFEDWATKKVKEGYYKEVYPKTKAFGKYAWCCKELSKAEKIFESLS